jgi:hypothetical protein
MVRLLLQMPDAPASIRGKYTCDRYDRERVLAVARTREAQVAKMQWDETLCGHRPNPGWTSRLGSRVFRSGSRNWTCHPDLRKKYM